MRFRFVRGIPVIVQSQRLAHARDYMAAESVWIGVRGVLQQGTDRASAFGRGPRSHRLACCSAMLRSLTTRVLRATVAAPIAAATAARSAPAAAAAAASFHRSAVASIAAPPQPSQKYGEHGHLVKRQPGLWIGTAQRREQGEDRFAHSRSPSALRFAVCCRFSSVPSLFAFAVSSRGDSSLG